MDVPELYHYGREGYWFGLKQFFIYVLDGTYQVSIVSSVHLRCSPVANQHVRQSVIVYFFVMYTYISTTSRTDGYDIRLTEWSTVMAIIGVMCADLFTGLTATAWTWWMFGLVFVGIVLVWGFTVSISSIRSLALHLTVFSQLIYSAVTPGYAVTFLYGNDYFLFTSAYFWLSLPIGIVVALAPRYLAKAYKFGYNPSDIDIVRWVRKKDPYRDLANDSQTHLGGGIGLHALKRQRRGSGSSSVFPPSVRAERRSSRADSIITLETGRMQQDVRSASRTDMSTGLVSRERGFDFATEERGVAIRRMQSNLSEKRLANAGETTSGKGKGSLGHAFSIGRGLKKTRTLLSRKGAGEIAG